MKLLVTEKDPLVRLSIRHGTRIEWRDEQEWPLARTRWTKLHLDAASMSLGWDEVSAEASTTYPMPDGGAMFEKRFYDFLITIPGSID